MYIPSRNNARSTAMRTGLRPVISTQPRGHEADLGLLRQAPLTQSAAPQGAEPLLAARPLRSKPRRAGRRSRSDGRSTEPPSRGIFTFYAQPIKPNCKLHQPQGVKLWLDQTIVFV